jgi:hypothetical protein
MGLFEQITVILTNDLAEYLADHFGLDALEVGYKITDYLEQNSENINQSKKRIMDKINDNNQFNKKNTNKNKNEFVFKPAVSGITTCKFKITRGNKGGQVCGTVVRSGGDYCSKHKNRKAATNSSNESYSSSD